MRSRDSARPELQHYNMDDDLGETQDLAEKQPQQFAELTKLFETIVAAGRSMPGQGQESFGPIDIRSGLRKKSP